MATPACRKESSATGTASTAVRIWAKVMAKSFSTKVLSLPSVVASFFMSTLPSASKYTTLVWALRMMQVAVDLTVVTTALTYKPCSALLIVTSTAFACNKVSTCSLTWGVISSNSCKFFCGLRRTAPKRAAFSKPTHW